MSYILLEVSFVFKLTLCSFAQHLFFFGFEQEVNTLWAGLGYYRRAKMLHAGAQKVMTDFHGQVPNTVAALKSIPGIGDYTAGMG